MISTRDLTLLPHPDQLRRLLQAMAMLDAILEEEWDNRYYAFDAAWSESQQMGSMRNGSGDDFFAVFEASGCFLRGCCHTSAMSPWRDDSPPKVWPGVLDKVPAQFESCLKEPAFHMQDTTFCIWWLAGDARWSVGSIDFPGQSDPDGSQWMLLELDGNPQTYQAYAKEYFELDVPLQAIARVYAHEPLSQELLDEFPSARDLEALVCDARDMAYPVKVQACARARHWRAVAPSISLRRACAWQRWLRANAQASSAQPRNLPPWPCQNQRQKETHHESSLHHRPRRQRGRQHRPAPHAHPPQRPRPGAPAGGHAQPGGPVHA